MKFTDLFVHRPVLASVISLLILLVGLRAIGSLEVRQYPETRDTVVTVTTSYPGANSELVKGFITTPLQQAIAEANGIDYLFSRSTQGLSTIEAHMELNYDPNAAVAEIQAKVASQRNVLPEESDDPVIDATTGGSHRADVHGVLQRQHAALADHRLPVARGTAAAAGGARCRQGGTDRQQDLRHAHLARPAAHGGAGSDRPGGARRAARQQLPGRRGAGQRRVYRHQPHRHHRPGQRHRFPPPGGARQQRHAGAPGGRRHASNWVPRTTIPPAGTRASRPSSSVWSRRRAPTR